MKIQFADKCAWRAIYVYAFGRQVLRLGFDPNPWKGPEVFFAILNDRHLGAHIPVPFARYRAGQSGLRTKWINWLLSLDGRF